MGEDALRPDGDRDVQQATLNLLADMHVLPSTPQPELFLSPASSDQRPPRVGSSSVLTGAVHSGQFTVLAGSSEDAGGGVVAAVEVSLDKGSSWLPAEVTPETGVWRLDPEALGVRPVSGVPWSISMAAGTQVRVRAADDSGNLSPETIVDVKGR